MKQVFLFAAMVVFTATGAQAVEFNTDALKSMQEEGHKIVEEAQAGRAYRAAGGLCLDIAGNGLVVRKCNAKSRTQQWSTDGQGRLVANDGRCVAGPQLAACGAAKAQKWKHDGKQRLANQNNMCLQVQSSPPQAGTRVVVAGCKDKAAAQVWR